MKAAEQHQRWSGSGFQRRASSSAGSDDLDIVTVPESIVQRVALLSDALHRSNAAAEQSHAHVRELEELVVHLEGQLERATLALGAEAEAKDQLSVELQARSRQVQALETSLDRERSANGVASDALADSRAKLTASRFENAKVHADLVSEQERASALDQALSSAQAALAAESNKRSEELARAEGQAAALRSREQEMRLHEEHVASLEKELQWLRSVAGDRAHAQAEVDQALDRAHAAEAARDRAIAEAMRSREEQRESAQALAEARASLQAARSECAEARREVRDLAASAVALESVRRDVADRDSELEAVEVRFATALAELGDAEAQVQARERDIAEARRAAGASEALLNQARRDLNEATEVEGRLEGALAAERLAAEDIRRELAASAQRCEQLQGRVEAETASRRSLLRELRNLRGNVRVVVRVRPLIAGGGAPDPAPAADVPGPGAVAVKVVDESSLRVGSDPAPFEADRVFGPDTPQVEVYEEIRPLIGPLLDGYDVCVLAYGPTGSGKTHTMTGYQADSGLNPRALHDLLMEADRRKDDYQVDIRVRMAEVYNETVRDLIGEAATGRRDGLAAEGDDLDGIFSMRVHSVEDVMTVMAIGHSLRARASTGLNTMSSRSHTIMSITTTAEHRRSGARTRGQMLLVDLAGSEDEARVARADPGSAIAAESMYINKSLRALGAVMRAHAQTPPSAADYSGSKLTQLLRPALCHETKMVVLLHVHPGERRLEETQQTLAFGSSVKQVALGPARPRVLPAAEAPVTVSRGGPQP